MNYKPFRNAYKITAEEDSATRIPNLEYTDPHFHEIIAAFGGKTFCEGLYRVLRSDQLISTRESIEQGFPEYVGRILPFGYDWLGRYFAIDYARVENNIPQVLRIESGAGEAMEIPASIENFHNVELVEYADDALSVPFWEQWRDINPGSIDHSKCVGYKVPLFLGGADILSNLEIIDVDVYIEICGQLRNKSRKLSVGETIRSVSWG